MKLASFSAIGLLVAGSFLVTLAGCQTDTPGATNTLGSYSTMIDGPPDKVTAAAEKAAGDLKLSDIVGNATKVDGKVTAKNAHGDAVTIEIEQAGEHVSKVSIRVGVTGDEAVSKQLVDKIKSRL
jgi:phage tail sheath gpL-like